MVNDDGVEWNIFFNAKTTPENIAHVAMWSTVMLKTTNHEWVGHDFQGRPITMKPLAKFRWVQAQNSYLQEAGWNNDVEGWVQPFLVAPALLTAD